MPKFVKKSMELDWNLQRGRVGCKPKNALRAGG